MYNGTYIFDTAQAAGDGAGAVVNGDATAEMQAHNIAGQGAGAGAGAGVNGDAAAVFPDSDSEEECSYVYAIDSPCAQAVATASRMARDAIPAAKRGAGRAEAVMRRCDRSQHTQ
jgi:hypothetical protein